MDRQVAEIASEPDRAAAYARLLLLQRGCADDASSAAELAAELPSTLLPLLLRDAAADDEAVAASALKCLGFALYHPVLVSTISAQMTQLVLDTLVHIIMSTRMKVDPADHFFLFKISSRLAIWVSGASRFNN